MSITARSELEPGLLPLHRFGTGDYLQMIKAGVLGPGDNVELIDGIIVCMSPAGPRHVQSVLTLNRLFAPILERAEIAVQVTLVVAEGQVFDPDFMLLKRKPGGYGRELPKPADVLLLIEVSDHSLQRDRQIKLPIYAAAGIAEYWIVDLEAHALHIHRNPGPRGYADTRALHNGDVIAPLAIPEIHLTVDQLFA
jgi:Uma2 family endonuclease